MGRPLLALGGIVLIGAGVALGFGWWWESSSQSDATVSQPITSVRIDTDSGDVTLSSADVPTTSVHQDFRYNFGSPRDGYSVDGGTLNLGDCGTGCSVSYRVVVPRGVAVTGTVDSGDLDLSGLASADVQAESGSIQLRDVTGPVKASADSGEVTGERLGDSVEASVDSGDVRLNLNRAQTVRAQTDSGSIELTVPNDRYRVDGSTDSGDRDIQVPVDPNAQRSLTLDTDSGDVTVRAA